MGHGGRRPGAGRKAGTATKKTREVANRANEEGLTPLDYLLSVMRNTANAPSARADAAKAAAPYVHPRLAPVEPLRSQDDTVPLIDRLKAYTREAAIEASEGKVVEMTRKGGLGR